MKLWTTFFTCILQLRNGFSRERTFLWFVLSVISIILRMDHFGVSSFVRWHWLKGSCYQSSLHFFHSSAVKLSKLTLLWIRFCLQHFPGITRINNHCVFIADGFKVPKEGKKMPGVKALHQTSDNNSKPSFIMGHSWQLFSLLIQTGQQFFAVPCCVRLVEGVLFSNRDKRTIFDKLLKLFDEMLANEKIYLLADSYYACKKMAFGLLSNGSHIITRLRTNSVAYLEAEPVKKKKRGRPKKYGCKIKLRNLFLNLKEMVTIVSPIYGEKNIQIKYLLKDLIWKPLGRKVRLILILHPTRGKCILMTTDLTLEAKDIIKFYGLRFKIEISIKQLLNTLGGSCYHFWMKNMTPVKRRQGDQHVHRKSTNYRNTVRKKIQTYELYLQTTVIALGILQYLSVCLKSDVWKSYNSWMRTMDKDKNPTEQVVAQAMRNTYFDFLHYLSPGHIWRKFIWKRIDFLRVPNIGLAG